MGWLAHPTPPHPTPHHTTPHHTTPHHATLGMPCPLQHSRRTLKAPAAPTLVSRPMSQSRKIRYAAAPVGSVTDRSASSVLPQARLMVTAPPRLMQTPVEQAWPPGTSQVRPHAPQEKGSEERLVQTVPQGVRPAWPGRREGGERHA